MYLMQLKYLLNTFVNVDRWQVSPSLSFANTCQTWTWNSVGTQYFDDSEKNIWTMEIELITPFLYSVLPWVLLCWHTLHVFKIILLMKKVYSRFAFSLSISYEQRRDMKNVLSMTIVPGSLSQAVHLLHFLLWRITDNLRPVHILSRKCLRLLPIIIFITCGDGCWQRPRFQYPEVILILLEICLIARFMGPTWDPPGADRTRVGPMLAPWTLLFGMLEQQHSFFFNKYMPLVLVSLGGLFCNECLVCSAQDAPPSQSSYKMMSLN